ncbi:Uncharacterised protein [Mycobacteroides abscessus subsp. massiliense]|nr:Uncharacterised protein [Mycobacteroides abscessus subsp. massiliense]
MDTTTGLPASRARTTSRQMVSEPLTEPPGLSTRSTMAATESSATASRSASAITSPPLAGPGGKSRGPLRPLTMGPASVTTPMAGRDGRPGSDDRLGTCGLVARA